MCLQTKSYSMFGLCQVCILVGAFSLRLRSGITGRMLVLTNEHENSVKNTQKPRMMICKFQNYLFISFCIHFNTNVQLCRQCDQKWLNYSYQDLSEKYQNSKVKEGIFFKDFANF